MALNVDQSNTKRQEIVTVDISDESTDSRETSAKKSPSIRIEKRNPRTEFVDAKPANGKEPPKSDPDTSRVQSSPKAHRNKHPDLNKNKTHKENPHANNSHVGNASTNQNNVSNGDILKFMEEFQSRFMSEAAAINNKIDEKMRDVRVDLTEQISKVATSLGERINEITSTIDERVEPAVAKIVEPVMQALETRVDKLEREALMLELNVSGIPWHANEKLHELIDCICKAIGFNDRLNGFSSFFRLPKKSQPTTQRPIGAKSNAVVSPPVILKFWTFGMKQDFFARYMATKTLNLTHIGYKTPSRIYINESLTAPNQEILWKARQLKQRKIINQCHTYRGLVYIRLEENSPNECVRNMDRLVRLEHSAQ